MPWEQRDNLPPFLLLLLLWIVLRASAGRSFGRGGSGLSPAVASGVNAACRGWALGSPGHP